ncbi:NAD-dependent epimerase/dehydratase family protein [Polynucleobacter kasalickyi]|uniref:Nucleoside-diphosphate-sugar epimerase n=1 Tax=Polynucleobacter kasalickyi TaxID=1938817 RepID=A0A1W2AL68_9BURK|nr:NAD(P)-dependent oxidoreductase [Polynucleobacter kasalickyi]SMC61403.1 Nucleoside-diphosphate-sugar epimerase [Polynucleobacter kasalickyi]
MIVLITGGTGFVGLNLAQQLCKKGFKPVLMALAPMSFKLQQQLMQANISFDFFQGSVSNSADLDRVCTLYKIDKIVHAAAITADGNREIAHTREILETNLMGSVEIFECAVRHHIKQVVYLSSGSIFGHLGTHDPMIDELTSPVLPETIYGISKLAAERTALRYRQNRQLNVTVVRLGLAYGPWEYDTGHRDTLSLPYKTYLKAKLGEHLVISKVHGDDYIYATDIAQGLSLILEAGKSPQGLYHLSAGMQWSIATWLENLQQLFPKFTYEMTDDPHLCAFKNSSPLPRSPMSIQRIQNDFHFEPHFDQASAFSDFISQPSILHSFTND